MQQSVRAEEGRSPLANPILDLAVVCLEAQLQAWQAYQVEGTAFVAKRLRANLECMRSLGHCGDIQSTGECQRAWLRDCQKDYAEEWARVVATTFALGHGNIVGMGWPFGRQTAEVCSETEPQSEPRPQPQPRPQRQSPLQSAA